MPVQAVALDDTWVHSSIHRKALAAKGMPDNLIDVLDTTGTMSNVKHLSELGAQLRRYFPEMDDTNNWIYFPFHALPPVHLTLSERESLIEIL